MNIQANQTRRSLLLVGMGALACTAGTAAAASLADNGTAAAHDERRLNRRLLRAIALHDRAEIACDRFDTEVEMPARNACTAALASYPNEPEPPHRESATTFVNVLGDTVRLSTAKIGAAAMARKVANDPTWADMGDDQWRQAHLQLAVAADERDAVIAAQTARRRVFESDTTARFRITALARRASDLSERKYALWSAVVTMPATTIADVVAKLDFIKREIRDGEDGFVLNAIHSDARRLSDGEA